MSDVKASSAMSSPSASALPGSERSDYRGKCLYKTGKCLNERALKTSGAAHNLCNEHRNKQNQHQRKLDAKNRLHKRERRVSTKNASGKRFAPYPSKRETLTASIASSDDVDSDSNAVASITAPASPAATSEGATSSTQAPVLATSSSGVMFLPNGPQPPQVACPFVMQDFDGIVVPLPSYLEGSERIEFRSRIYQKVLDFISEECILRFGAKVETASIGAPNANATEMAPMTQTSNSELETKNQADSEKNALASSDDHVLATDTSVTQQNSSSMKGKSKSTKKVH